MKTDIIQNLMRNVIYCYGFFKTLCEIKRVLYFIKIVKFFFQYDYIFFSAINYSQIVAKSNQ